MEFKMIEAAGKSYRLSYTTNALCQLEDKVDGVVLSGLAVRKVNTFIRYMLWAALICHHPKTTIEQAGCIADAYVIENGGRDAAFKLIQELQVMAGLIKPEEVTSEETEKNGEAPQEEI